MRIAEELSLHRWPAKSDEDAPRSGLLLNGQPTGVELSCAVLEAAVATSRGFVLFTTDDTPFEDLLGIHLLDPALQPLDAARIGGPYTTGSFSNLELLPPDRMRFRFIGDTDWTLTWLPEPVLRTPFNAEPTGVWRGLGLRRHFTIDGRPKPEPRR